MKERWKESDEGMDVPPLECHEADLSLASSKEVNDRVRTTIVFGQPLFADHSTKAGTETCGEASEPEAIYRDRET